MKVMTTFVIRPGATREAVARFLAGDGAPVEGTTLLGRWFSVDLSQGFALYQTDDSVRLAIPVGNDQPGVAARLKWVGAAEFLPLKHLNAKRLRSLIKQVLDQPQYRQRAQQMMAEVQKANGIERAMGFIEGALISNPGWAQRSETQVLSRVVAIRSQFPGE